MALRCLGRLSQAGWGSCSRVGRWVRPLAPPPPPTLARREVEAERCDCGVKVPRHPTCDAGVAGLSSALMRSGPAHSPEALRIPG